jgi:hypothetical protein
MIFTLYWREEGWEREGRRERERKSASEPASPGGTLIASSVMSYN